MSTIFSINSYTPPQVTELVSRAGAFKGRMNPHRVFLSPVSAGCLLSFASASSLMANTSPWLQENAPGVARILGGFVFPYGLVLCLLTGADLCTSTFMFTTVATLHRRLPIVRMLLHWFICFWGNLAGALFMVAIIFGYGNVFGTDPYKAEVISNATMRQVTPDWHMIFLRAIGCDWLVCLGCFFGMQGRDLASKIVGIWCPIFGFASLGLDHVVANMFFIPMGIWVGHPDITVGMYIWKGIIPALLGNILGGALFCGAYYWYTYLYDQEEMLVDGVPYQERRDEESGHHTSNSDEGKDTGAQNGSSLSDMQRLRETRA